MTKSAFGDVKDKTVECLDKAFELWNNEKTRDEIVTAVSHDEDLQSGKINGKCNLIMFFCSN